MKHIKAALIIILIVFAIIGSALVSAALHHPDSAPSRIKVESLIQVEPVAFGQRPVTRC